MGHFDYPEVSFPQAVNFDRNRWSLCSGIGGQVGPEWVVTLDRNKWSCSSRVMPCPVFLFRLFPFLGYGHHKALAPATNIIANMHDDF